MRPPKLLLYVTGEAPTPVVTDHGGKETWYRRLLDAWTAACGRPVELHPFDASTGHLPAGLDSGDGASGGFDGVIVTGSASSLTAPEPWMEAGVELIRLAHGRRLPLLGVCFGHQMIGAAFGGSVVQNPKGWEVSTRTVSLNERGRGDPLFAGMPEHFDVNFSHRDIIDPETLSPHNGVETLAANGHTAVQAIAAGPSVRGVQFHPEFDGAITAALIRIDREYLEADAAFRAPGDPSELPDALAAAARDCPIAEDVMHNFLDHFVDPYLRR